MKKVLYLIIAVVGLSVMLSGCLFGGGSKSQENQRPSDSEIKAMLERSFEAGYSIDEIFLNQTDVPDEAHYQLTNIDVISYSAETDEYELITAEITGESGFATATATVQFISRHNDNGIFHPRMSTYITYSIFKEPTEEFIQAFYENEICEPYIMYYPDLLETSITPPADDSESFDYTIHYKLKYKEHAYKSVTEIWSYVCSFETGFWQIDKESLAREEDSFEYYLIDQSSISESAYFPEPDIVGDYEVEFTDPVRIDPDDPFHCCVTDCRVKLRDDSLFDASDVRIDIYYTLLESEIGAHWERTETVYRGDVKLKNSQPTVIGGYFFTSDLIEVTIKGLRYNDNYGYMFLVDVRDLRENPIGTAIEDGERLMRLTSPGATGGWYGLENPLVDDISIFVTSDFIPYNYI